MGISLHLAIFLLHLTISTRMVHAWYLAFNCVELQLKKRCWLAGIIGEFLLKEEVSSRLRPSEEPLPGGGGFASPPGPGYVLTLVYLCLRGVQAPLATVLALLCRGHP